MAMEEHCRGGNDDGDDDHDLETWVQDTFAWAACNFCVWNSYNDDYASDDGNLAGSETPRVVRGVVEHYVWQWGAAWHSLEEKLMMLMTLTMMMLSTSCVRAREKVVTRKPSPRKTRESKVLPSSRGYSTGAS